MGRLIDETNLMNLLYALDDARHELFYAIKKIPELPTVEAIPKADYETRLKADMVAMLDKIRAEIEEHAKINQNLNIDRARALCWCLDVIDKYKAEGETQKRSE